MASVRPSVFDILAVIRVRTRPLYGAGGSGSNAANFQFPQQTYIHK